MRDAHRLWSIQGAAELPSFFWLSNVYQRIIIATPIDAIAGPIQNNATIPFATSGENASG